MGYIRLIITNFTSWHIIFAKLKSLENTKSSISNILINIVHMYKIGMVFANFEMFKKWRNVEATKMAKL